jgi:MFS transporter, DHA2 family, multidrug resistance protein
LNPALPRSPAGPYNPWAVAVMIALAPLMEVMDTTIANVSLPHIAGSLGVSQSESTWVLTSYLVSNSIILPISGWLANVVGRKRFFQICTALFIISSVMCAASTSLNMLIVARVLQGLGGGGLAPVAQSMMADSFVPEKRPQVFALFGFIIIVAPATGPVLGGWLTDAFSWHWIFLINLPVGLIALTLTSIFTVEPKVLREERTALLTGGRFTLDYVGLALVAIGFGSLQMFLDKFEVDDGFASPFIIGSFASAITALSFLAVWEWQQEHPVMNIRLLLNRNFGIVCFVSFLVSFCFLSSTQLLPQMAQTLLGYTSRTSGLSLALGGICTLTFMPVSAYITGRWVQPRFLMAAGLIQMGVALISDSHFSPYMSFDQLTWARVLQVFAMPFIFVPMSTSAFIGVKPKYFGDAAALSNQMRNIGGSMGISFATNMLTTRSQFHHARLAEVINPYRPLPVNMSVQQFDQAVQFQANFISYLDVFHILGILALVVWPVALLLRPPPNQAA